MLTSFTTFTSSASFARLGLLFCSLTLSYGNVAAQEDDAVLFTGKNSGVASIDDLRKLHENGQKVLCGAFGERMRASCGALSKRLRIDIEIISFPSSGPAIATAAANRVTFLPLTLRFAQSVQPSDPIRPIASTGQALTLHGREVPSIGYAGTIDNSRQERVDSAQALQAPINQEQKAGEIQTKDSSQRIRQAAGTCFDNNNGTYTGKDGTIWQKCLIGQSWDAGAQICTGSPRQVSWTEAISSAAKDQFLSRSDWIIPTEEVFARSLGDPKCRHPRFSMTEKSKSVYAKMAQLQIEGASLWTSNPGRSPVYLSRAYYDGFGTTSDLTSNSYKDNLGRVQPIYAVLVTGTLDRTAFDQALTRVRDFVSAEASRVQKEESDRQDRSRRIAEFRRTVKVGDDSSMGTVIEVKGNLVKIQTNESQCSQRDYKGACVNWINTPAERWFKRDEIEPK